jgi:hypothetical protein
VRRVFQTTLILVLLGFSTSIVLACTCVQESLSKRYRSAKAVFIGQALDRSQAEPDQSLIQGQGDQTIAVSKSWKGIKKKYVSLTFRHETSATCQTLYHLEPGNQYLVFAYGNQLEVRSVCPDTWVIPSDKSSPGYEELEEFMKRLNSRWFRLKTRLNPF